MNNPNKSAIVHGLLIAAGASRRLGQPKQLVHFKGKYLINHIIEQLNNSELNNLKIVLGSKSESITPLINSEADLYINELWETGMGSSISHGVNNITDTVDGICISLVDQFHMTSELINSLIKGFSNDPSKLIICKYGNDVYGPPAIFPNRLFGELKLLKGDRGAGKIIQNEIANHPNEVIVIDFENGHLDIDTPEDLLKLSE